MVVATFLGFGGLGLVWWFPRGGWFVMFFVRVLVVTVVWLRVVDLLMVV